MHTQFFHWSAVNPLNPSEILLGIRPISDGGFTRFTRSCSRCRSESLNKPISIQVFRTCFAVQAVNYALGQLMQTVQHHSKEAGGGQSNVLQSWRQISVHHLVFWLAELCLQHFCDHCLILVPSFLYQILRNQVYHQRMPLEIL
mgnify:CR=1 FL=1